MRVYSDFKVTLLGTSANKRHSEDSFLQRLPKTVSVTADSPGWSCTETVEHIHWEESEEIVRKLNADSVKGNDLQKLGSELLGILLPGKVRKHFLETLADIRRATKRDGQHRGLRLRVKCNSEELASMPWEACWSQRDSDFGGKYLLQSADLSMVREDFNIRQEERLAMGREVRFATVDASEVARGDAIVSDVPINLAAPPGLTFHIEAIPPTEQSLKQVFDVPSKQFQVFHFSGHAADITSDVSAGLQFGSDDRPHTISVSINGQRLANYLALAKVQLAVISACNSGARGSSADIADSQRGSASVALALAESGIPAVVAMQHRVRDIYAQMFSQEFYKALLEGDTLDEAVQRGRHILMRDPGQFGAWTTPVLYLNAKSSDFLGPLIIAEPQSHGPSGAVVPIAGVRTTRTWAQLTRRDRNWRIAAGPKGLLRLPLDGELDKLALHESGDGASVVVSADARVAAQLSGALLNVAWINRITGALERWRTPVDLLPADQDTRLLAVSMAGSKQVRCVISGRTGTYEIRVGRMGEVLRTEPIIAEASRAALLVGRDVWTADTAGRLRDNQLSELLPGIEELIMIDAAGSGGHLLVAALGRSQDGRNVLLLRSRTAERSRAVDTNAVDLAVVRQLDPRIPSDCVVTTDGAIVTAFTARPGQSAFTKRSGMNPSLMHPAPTGWD